MLERVARCAGVYSASRAPWPDNRPILFVAAPSGRSNVRNPRVVAGSHSPLAWQLHLVVRYISTASISEYRLRAHAKRGAISFVWLGLIRTTYAQPAEALALRAQRRPNLGWLSVDAHLLQVDGA
jgi:hypothetical protein